MSGTRVMSVRGFDAPHACDYECLRDLIRPHLLELATLVPEHADELRRLTLGSTTGLDPGRIRGGFLHLLTELAITSPTWVILDDFDLIDAPSADTVRFAVSRLATHRLTTILTGTQRIEWPEATRITLAAVADQVLIDLLAARGLATLPARAGARSARGLPGMAIAFADALSEAQRRGGEWLPALIQPDPSLTQRQQRVLETLDPATLRALVVIAADESGSVGAVRSALMLLGEQADALDDAERHGVIEIDGPTVRFTDPWTRPAAYFLVAPAIRRAAHRALAESYDEPHDALARAWHMAAAANGPCDHVAEALELLAADTARSSHIVAAVDTYCRAADLAESGEFRQRLLLTAMQTAVDGLELALARDIAVRIPPSTPDTNIAVADTLELAGVSVVAPLDDTRVADGPWSTQRQLRIRRQLTARSGQLDAVVDNHGDARRDVPIEITHALVARAQLERHAGRLSSARDQLVRLESMLTPSCTELLAVAHTLHADLDHLAGRFDDADAHLRLVRRPADIWTRHLAEWVRTRIECTMTDRTGTPWSARLGVDVALGQLAEVRAARARAFADNDSDSLEQVAGRAVALGLVIEAAETNLARLELIESSGRRSIANGRQSVCSELWHLGVHGWDRRLTALESAATNNAAADLLLLSQAERRVADAVGVGMTNREAATALFLSVKTVDFHLQQIYRKLAIRSRTELAVLILGSDRGGRTRAVS